ncbi:hypothetical protein [Streptomyces sp. NBC_01306]|uniref:hypothetical protein n=1 Tax=Streptomyces sp. NBC_01306 TaxID=2903819 RepID=UPI00224FD00C|nr:hypothetical protein [Streptomyces sp. NBC_01306]MCX4723773.1 hypothetical protein [Streptomyces sp. NBC_01306]
MKAGTSCRKLRDKVVRREIPTVARRGDGFAVRFTKWQRDLLAGSIEPVTNLRTEEAVLIRTGFTKNQITQIESSLDGLEEHTYSVKELHVIYSVLVSVCSMFGPEEAFHTRTGFFRENALGLAEGLVKAVGDARTDS